jgi:uncharacterized protein (TIGR02996 family)
LKSEELLAAIRAAPDDDNPRLVYADWLTQQDDPRGEFIAVQCALASGEDERRLKWRDEELRRVHASRWIGMTCTATLVRGFVDVVTVESHEVSLAAFEDLWRREPAVRRLEVEFPEHATTGICEVLASPVIEGLRELLLHGARNEEFSYGDDLVRALASNPALRLRKLRLSWGGVTSRALRLLLESPVVPELRELDLAGASFGDDGARELVYARFRLSRLEKLDVSHSEVTASGRERLEKIFPGVEIFT